MKTRSAIVGVFLIATAFATWAQVPVPVVERIITETEVTTRLTLFSNQVLVVTINQDGVQGFNRRITLPDDQYIVYLGILQTNAEELGERPITSAIRSSRSEVFVTLHLGPDAPREIRFSPLATVSLELARINGALNDLELLVREASPSSEELRTWEPKRGDRVELMNGTFARVAEVLDGGVLTLEHEETFIREWVSLDARDQVILHVVERQK